MHRAEFYVHSRRTLQWLSLKVKHKAFSIGLCGKHRIKGGWAEEPLFVLAHRASAPTENENSSVSDGTEKDSNPSSRSPCRQRLPVNLVNRRQHSLRGRPKKAPPNSFFNPDFTRLYHSCQITIFMLLYRKYIINNQEFRIRRNSDWYYLENKSSDPIYPIPYFKSINC